MSATAAVSATAPASAALSKADNDAIDRLVARLRKSPLWSNGLFPKLDLPATATTEEVLAAMFAATSSGKANRHQVLLEREVSLSSSTYKALVVESDQGQQIVLMQHHGDRTGWWTRVFPFE